MSLVVSEHSLLLVLRIVMFAAGIPPSPPKTNKQTNPQQQQNNINNKNPQQNQNETNKEHEQTNKQTNTHIFAMHLRGPYTSHFSPAHNSFTACDNVDRDHQSAHRDYLHFPAARTVSFVTDSFRVLLLLKSLLLAVAFAVKTTLYHLL